MEGLGRRSCDKLLEAIDRSRETTPARVLGAIGIPGIGISGARILCSHFRDDLEEIRKADETTLSEVEGIGPVLAQNIRKFFDDARLTAALDDLLGELHLQKESAPAGPQILAGKTFVITGSVHRFANRNELKDKIMSLGGKAAGSVSSKTDYLINNDVTSSSSKNKKARELGIPILSEEDFLAMIGEE
jgi:DNA ligase (NAD+)